MHSLVVVEQTRNDTSVFPTGLLTQLLTQQVAPTILRGNTFPDKTGAVDYINSTLKDGTPSLAVPLRWTSPPRVTPSSNVPQETRPNNFGPLTNKRLHKANQTDFLINLNLG